MRREARFRTARFSQGFGARDSRAGVGSNERDRLFLAIFLSARLLRAAPGAFAGRVRLRGKARVTAGAVGRKRSGSTSQAPVGATSSRRAERNSDVATMWLTCYSALRTPTACAVGHRMSRLPGLKNSFHLPITFSLLVTRISGPPWDPLSLPVVQGGSRPAALRP